MMNTENQEENVIVVDADYLDKVAFDLIVNFERMLGRRIPQADMAQWAECAALDGGVKPVGAGSKTAKVETTRVILLYEPVRTSLENFVPGEFSTMLSGHGFSGPVGQFVFSSFPVVSEFTTKQAFFLEVLGLQLKNEGVKRIVAVPDEEAYLGSVRDLLAKADDEKRITLLTMQPVVGGNYRQQVLGYSLLRALGISADELSTIQ